MKKLLLALTLISGASSLYAACDTVQQDIARQYKILAPFEKEIEATDNGTRAENCQTIQVLMNKKSIYLKASKEVTKLSKACGLPTVVMGKMTLEDLYKYSYQRITAESKSCKREGL